MGFLRRSALIVSIAACLFALPAAAMADTPSLDPLPNAAGVNDYSCQPPPRHPFPIVVVHGTASDQQITNLRIAPLLKRLGYCVFSLDYGLRGLGDIPKSADALSHFVDGVLKATGAKKVSFVGHSQGGMLPRYYVKFLGGADKTDDLVAMVPSNHGTALPLAPLLGITGLCPACEQQTVGSAFNKKLNEGDQTPQPVDYTVITTRYDEIVNPYTSAFLPQTADNRVTNEVVQVQCPGDLAEHLGIIFDDPALQWMLSALGRPGPADPNLKINCNGIRANTWPDTDSVTSK